MSPNVLNIIFGTFVVKLNFLFSEKNRLTQLYKDYKSDILTLNILRRIKKENAPRSSNLESILPDFKRFMYLKRDLFTRSRSLCV